MFQHPPSPVGPMFLDSQLQFLETNFHCDKRAIDEELQMFTNTIINVDSDNDSINEEENKNSDINSNYSNYNNYNSNNNTNYNNHSNIETKMSLSFQAGFLSDHFQHLDTHFHCDRDYLDAELGVSAPSYFETDSECEKDEEDEEDEDNLAQDNGQSVNITVTAA
eukprot:Pgem_evm1s9983